MICKTYCFLYFFVFVVILNIKCIGYLYKLLILNEKKMYIKKVNMCKDLK